MIIAPRGPRKVLCVVVVTTSTCGKGDGCAPPATRPATWLMSAMEIAPTDSAISGEALKVNDAGYAVARTRSFWA